MLINNRVAHCIGGFCVALTGSIANADSIAAIAPSTLITSDTLHYLDVNKYVATAKQPDYYEPALPGDNKARATHKQLVISWPGKQRNAGLLMTTPSRSVSRILTQKEGMPARKSHSTSWTIERRQGVFRWERALNGLRVRVAPAATQMPLLLGATVFGGHQLATLATDELNYIGEVRANLQAITCATVGTDATYLVAGAALTIAGSSRAVKPQLCDGAVAQGAATGLLLGAYAKSVYLDAAGRAFQPYLEMQYRQKITQGLLIFGGVSNSLAQTAIGSAPPDSISYHVGITVGM